MRAIDVIRKLAPRARPDYLAAFEAGDNLLRDYGLTTPLRLAHFLAQVLHESGGLTVLRESGAYSAARIVEIFGVGRHSAAVTPAEAKTLAKSPSALFERVYGLGNPDMARRLGNTQPGDGWRYRGNGIMQTTGRENHRRMGELVGLGTLFEDRPEAVTQPGHALLPALAEWKQGGCNPLADKDNLTAISKVINLGNANSRAKPNGLADRGVWFKKVLPLLEREGVSFGAVDPATPSAASLTEKEIRALQQRLRDLGYAEVGRVDGLWGPKTEAGITAFQVTVGLPLTKTFDEATAAALAIAGPRPVGESRAATTAATLRQHGDEVQQAILRGKGWIAGLGGSAGVIGIAGWISEATGYVSSAKALLSGIPDFVWLALVAAIAVALWRTMQQAERAALDNVRTGRDAGPA